MSNFLALCKAVRRDCGVSGAGPTSVVGQTGVLLKIIEWTAKAWIDIQRKRRDWRFMAASHAGSLSTTKQAYNAADFSLSSEELGEIDKDSFFLGSDLNPLEYFDWLDWRNARHGIDLKVTKPQRWTVNLSGHVVLDAIPDKNYSFTFDYRKALQTLSANNDTPYIPSDYDDTIVALAVKYYADYNEIASLSDSAGIRHIDAMTDLENDKSPTVTFSQSKFGSS